MDLTELTRALFDPTAPLPTGWPSGGLGALLLFMVPVGGGIPLGVLMARDAGLSPLVTALLYLVSDVVLAFTTEPLLIGLKRLGRVVPPLAALGHRLSRLTQTAGFTQDGARGPLGLILVAFAVSPTTGRAAAAAAGHGFLPGWALAIIGDMGYFTLLMASTLWLSGVFGDERVTVGAVLIMGWVLPMVLSRLHRRFSPSQATAAARQEQRMSQVPTPSAAPMRAALATAQATSARGQRRSTRPKSRRRF